jgi:hypothetical protein
MSPLLALPSKSITPIGKTIGNAVRPKLAGRGPRAEGGDERASGMARDQQNSPGRPCNQVGIERGVLVGSQGSHAMMITTPTQPRRSSLGRAGEQSNLQA